MKVLLPTYIESEQAMVNGIVDEKLIPVHCCRADNKMWACDYETLVKYTPKRLKHNLQDMIERYHDKAMHVRSYDADSITTLSALQANGHINITLAYYSEDMTKFIMVIEYGTGSYVSVSIPTSTLTSFEVQLKMAKMLQVEDNLSLTNIGLDAMLPSKNTQCANHIRTMAIELPAIIPTEQLLRLSALQSIRGVTGKDGESLVTIAMHDTPLLEELQAEQLFPDLYVRLPEQSILSMDSSMPQYRGELLSSVEFDKLTALIKSKHVFVQYYFLDSTSDGAETTTHLRLTVGMLRDGIVCNVVYSIKYLDVSKASWECLLDPHSASSTDVIDVGDGELVVNVEVCDITNNLEFILCAGKDVLTLKLIDDELDMDEVRFNDIHGSPAKNYAALFDKIKSEITEFILEPVTAPPIEVDGFGWPSIGVLNGLEARIMQLVWCANNDQVTLELVGIMFNDFRALQFSGEASVDQVLDLRDKQRVIVAHIEKEPIVHMKVLLSMITEPFMLLFNSLTYRQNK